MKLSVRLAAAFVAFVVTGSLALVMWLRNEEQRQSRDQFAAMARTNAEFIRAQNLPLTERTAKPLGKALGVEVRLWEGTRRQAFGTEDERRTFAVQWGPAIAEALLNSGDVKPKAGAEAIHLEFEPGRHALFFRMQPPGTLLFNQRTFVILGVFWILSLALAFALARGIVRPLRALATRLPRISEEKDEPIPETARTDEIGQLARAYAGTRSQLAAERETRQQAERLAALGKMATGLAHEINNPVAAIKLHAQLLEEAGEGAGGLREEIATRLPIILAESAKIESLVSQWMFLARPQPPQVSPCDFGEILANAILALTPAAEHAGVRMINEVPLGFTINADRRRMAQAVTNVINNAIHAMAAHGGILKIQGQPCPNLHPSSFMITFTDTGPGFSPGALAHGTELFFSEKEGGMGIGLNVTSGIISAHGGELHIANAPGGGAVVTLILPALPMPSKPESTP